MLPLIQVWSSARSRCKSEAHPMIRCNDLHQDRGVSEAGSEQKEDEPNNAFHY